MQYDVLNIIYHVRVRAVITSQQIRAARALLHLSQSELAGLAKLSLPTIQRMEASRKPLSDARRSARLLVRALANAGVEILNEPEVVCPQGQGRGVRLIR